MKKKKIGIAIILLVVLFSGLFLWWWTKPIKITTNKIVKVTIKGYDAEVVSSNKQCIQEAIQLVENTRAIPLGDWAVKYIGGDSPDLMVMFRDDKDDAIASVSYYGNIVMDENSYYYLLDSEDSIDEKITQLSKRYEDKKQITPYWYNMSALYFFKEVLSMAQIMIVEDNQGTNKAICEYLKTAGHTLFPALDGEEALNIFRDNSIDLAVLDIMLPKMSGVTILHEIRKISNIPVVMLTAVDDEYTQSNSFDELADDYITKPFSMLILGKRITALLRRSENKSTVSTIRLGNVTVDFAGYTAHDENGKIDITPKELEILKVLIENKGLVLSRNQILDDVWGYDCDVIDRTIDAYIRNIRKKLRLDCITTVKGIGYKFEMENHYENKAIL